MNFLAGSHLLQGMTKCFAINDSEKTACHTLAEFDQIGPFCNDGRQRGAGDIRFSLSIEEFIRDDADKSAAHQGTALAGADELFAGNGVHEFQEAAVQVGIAPFAWGVKKEGIASQL